MTAPPAADSSVPNATFPVLLVPVLVALAGGVVSGSGTLAG